MGTVNMLEAKSTLSKLVQDLETGKEREIIIARNGKPVARLVPIEQPDRRLDFAEGEQGSLVEASSGDFRGLGSEIQDVIDARWERFERHSLDLEQKYGEKKEKAG